MDVWHLQLEEEAQDLLVLLHQMTAMVVAQILVVNALLQIILFQECVQRIFAYLINA